MPEGYRPSPEPHFNRVIGIEGSKVPWGEASIGFQREGVSTTRTTLHVGEPLLKLASATEFEHMTTC